MLWLVLPVGCAIVQTEEGKITLWSYDVSTLGTGRAPAEMLHGTVACLERDAPWCATELSGLSNAGSCAIFDEIGEATLEFVGCPESDTIRFDVIAPSDVEAKPIDIDQAARENLSFNGELPPSQEEDRWRIVSDDGGYVTVFPRLFREGREVGFRFRDASVSADVWMGEAPQIESDFGSWSEIRVETGALGRLMFDIDRPAPYGLHLPFMKYHGVSPDDVYSMSISVAYLGGLPYAARAILRDAEGNQLRGAPVAWTLDEGTLSFENGSFRLPGPDHTWLTDACVTQPVPQRTAVLRATYGWLTATVPLQWTNLLSVTDPADGCVGPSDPPPLSERPVPTAQDPSPVGVLAVYPRAPRSAARWSGGCDSAGVPTTGARLTAALGALAASARRRDRRSCRR